MTTIREITVRCALCGHQSMHAFVTSTSEFGSPDLDTRPPYPARSVFEWSVQRCPNCGYCATRVSNPGDGATEIVRGEQYQRQLRDPNLPQLANSFLCEALILESVNDHAGAGWARIRAAWACDDAGVVEGAQGCRIEAVRALEEARARQQRFADQPGAEEAIIIDLLRRAGQFARALEVSERALEQPIIDIIERVIRFERELIRRGDNSIHLVSDAL